MELSELIRCKHFDSETHHKLLEFARGNNFVEDLLDYVIELESQIDPDFSKFVSKIDELKTQIANKDKELAYFHGQIEASSKSLEEFIEKTKKEQNRYPSFDEAWSESENRFLKIENKTC